MKKLKDQSDRSEKETTLLKSQATSLNRENQDLLKTRQENQDKINELEKELQNIKKISESKIAKLQKILTEE